MRGLKLKDGVWHADLLTVAPHTGAWIETIKYKVPADQNLSHPTRVRGLKLLIIIFYRLFLVAPHTGAWIETEKHGLDLRDGSSHPTRVRGLKPCYLGFVYQFHQSHPTRVRGLKLVENGRS